LIQEPAARMSTANLGDFAMSQPHRDHMYRQIKARKIAPGRNTPFHRQAGGFLALTIARTIPRTCFQQRERDEPQVSGAGCSGRRARDAVRCVALPFRIFG